MIHFLPPCLLKLRFSQRWETHWNLQWHHSFRFFFLFILTNRSVCKQNYSDLLEFNSCLASSDHYVHGSWSTWAMPPAESPLVHLVLRLLSAKCSPSWGWCSGPHQQWSNKNLSLITWQYHSSSCSVLQCICPNSKNSPKRKDSLSPHCLEFCIWIRSLLHFPLQSHTEQC